MVDQDNELKFLSQTKKKIIRYFPFLVQFNNNLHCFKTVFFDNGEHNGEWSGEGAYRLIVKTQGDQGSEKKQKSFQKSW